MCVCALCVRMRVEAGAGRCCSDVRRVTDDVDGRYGNMTRQQLQQFADDLRCQVNSGVIIVIILLCNRV